jgi:hypothetical protein
MVPGSLMGRRESGVLARESGGLEGKSGRWFVDDDGEGENGSMDVARWRFERRESRNAVQLFSCVLLCM